MVVSKEYQVVLPMTVDEYQVAQLWSVAEASKNETGGGEGVEVRKNEPYENKETGEKGQYTYKVYHLASRVPAFIKMVAPAGSLEIYEEAWNAFPYCKTVLTNGYMKDSFHITIKTWHLPDAGTTVNPHKLPPNEWRKVTPVKIDIANDAVSSGDYKPEFDPKTFKSQKTGRGPLGPNWIAETMAANADERADGNTYGKTPIMCCYKLVEGEFKWWGIQGRVETLIHNQEKRLFTTFHRQLFCWIDQWHGLTMADIRALEDKTKEDLEKMIASGEVKGTKISE